MTILAAVHPMPIDRDDGPPADADETTGVDREALAMPAVPRDRGQVTDPAPFERLSRRHRECLRGVRELKGSKEIADELGIEKSTVDKYLTEAVKVLGARNRRDAALRLAAHEEAAGQGASDPQNPQISANSAAQSDPDKMGGHSARLVDPAIGLPLPVVPDDTIVRAPGVSGEPPSRHSFPEIRLPFRRKGQRGNDLSVGGRLIWIPAIAISLAIGFGMLMTGLQVLTGIIETIARRLS
ncbi:helix-turn-helix transcriptional regulator [Sphingomonas sp. 2SG]|uniref:helix-turn-helix domain-containing protein n=1 Tax=Sphingomonas sp. 2SG TaxID=2502201 RepID=UPI0020160624|nr:helix-turn-helix transcriptional regulator [Sphingomonas sp. 2SG]